MARPYEIGNPFAASPFATSQIAPVATSAILRTVDSAPLTLATHPYTGCARIATNPTGGRYWVQITTPHTRHDIAAVGGNSAPTGGRPPSPVQIASADGGLTGTNIILAVASPWTLDTDPMDVTATGSVLAVTSQQIDDSPAAQKARAIEIVGNDTATAVVCWIDNATVWSLTPFDFDPDWP
jgi:hypothetical protein